MHDERIAARPSDVLGLPVTVAYTQPPRCRGQSFSHAAGSVINPLGPADEVEVLPVLIKVGPQSSPGMVPSRPRRRERQIGDRRWGGCRSDQASDPGSLTAEGTPLAARATAARISASCPVQYKSYFDATLPVSSATLLERHSSAADR